MLFIIYRGEDRERVGTLSLQGEQAFGYEVPSQVVRAAIYVREERSAAGCSLLVDSDEWHIEASNKFD